MYIERRLLARVQNLGKLVFKYVVGGKEEYGGDSILVAPAAPLETWWRHVVQAHANNVCVYLTI